MRLENKRVDCGARGVGIGLEGGTELGELLQ